MSYDAEAIANHFLDLADQNKRQLTAMQLQKLIYFAHGWYLAFTGQPLIRQRLEAWTYGPVVPDVYREFKHFGARPLVGVRAVRRDGHTCKGEWSSDYDTATLPSPDEDAGAEELRGFLGRIYKTYSPFSGSQLSAMTHVPGGPWAKTRALGQCRAWINDNDIQDYFRACLDQDKAF